jgi:hypothetical protein
MRAPLQRIVFLAIGIMWLAIVRGTGSATSVAANASASNAAGPAVYGRWETVIPNAGGAATERILGMQTVHAVLLPSGKVLWASGSSWRNHDPVAHYPNVAAPKPGTGVFGEADDPFRKSNLASYYDLVNNVAIYDPEQNTFYRIPHPVPVDDPQWSGHFAPSDLFCTGHIHLPDGNVLFTGGTQYYFPFRTGNRSTYIFDWKKEMDIPWRDVDWRKIPAPKEDPWIFSGFMPRGRWYASILPLLDGRMAVMSGFVDKIDRGSPPMYQFEINHLVDFFDPAAFNPGSPQAAWQSIDVQKLPDSPFSTVINPGFKPADGVACDTRCVDANQRDAFKLYPENYLMPDGRIYLTREGDWVSLRTASTAFMRKTSNTYWATIGGTRTTPSMTFAPGPNRPDVITSYGTTYLDPNTGNITLLGGQPTSSGTLLPMNSTPSATPEPTHFAGGRGSRKMEEFHVDSLLPGGGEWTLDPDFLGNTPQDDRTMHYAITLPTRQILVLNGGNYDFYGPVFYPLLFTPRYSGSAFAGYDKVRMSEGVEPRLYHNTALLLPDGRVLVSGGNTSRATVRPGATSSSSGGSSRSGGQQLPDLNRIDIDMYFFRDGPMAKGSKGMHTIPTEDWVAEMFSPPYLFIDPSRRAAITSIAPEGATSGHQFESQTHGKTFSLLHSNADYRVHLQDLPKTCASGANASLNLIKLSSATHGWENGQQFVDLQPSAVSGTANEITFHTPDAREANIPPAFYMMFYVDCAGKPSVARMVRFDDGAKTPLDSIPPPPVPPTSILTRILWIVAVAALLFLGAIVFFRLTSVARSHV